MSSSVGSIKSFASTASESISVAASSSKNTSFENMAKSSSPANVASGNFKLLLLIMMVLQNSATVLVGRYTRAGVPKDQVYDVNHLIFLCEFAKFVLSCALEYHTTNGKLAQSLQIHVFAHPADALKILVPALLYLVQNTLLYVALSNLTAPLFQVTYQGKLVTTAIVSVIMLARRYSFQQWVCLVTLSLGVAIVVLGEQKDKQPSASNNAGTSQNLALGLTSVTIACMSSALAGVYFEKVLKKPTTVENGSSGSSDSNKPSHAPPSLWMRNIQLAFFSFLIAAVQGMLKPTPEHAVGRSYLHGFTVWVWILVALQAGGGLLVAAVIKYADNVLKGLATGVSVVLATALSMVLFGTPLTGQFTMGAFLILTSVYVFSNPVKVPGMTKEKDGESTEMKNLLPK